MPFRPVSGRELRSLVDHPLLTCVVRDDDPAVVGPVGWAVLHGWGMHWQETGGTALAPGHESEALAALLASAPTSITDRLGWFGTERGVTLSLPEPWRETPDKGGDWDFMTAHRVVAPDPSVTFVELDDAADADEITAFNAAHNPQSEGAPGKGRTHLWLGVRDAGRLVAVGAWQPLVTGVPYFAGLVVDSAQRGRGLGTALLAELSRRALAEHDIVCLGVDGANHRAAALYERMGFAHSFAFHSIDVHRA